MNFKKSSWATTAGCPTGVVVNTYHPAPLSSAGQ
jgi:hypothetical protein